jgi:predicted DNA-binding transcriptional regulator AlpA
MDTAILIPIPEALARSGIGRSFLYQRLADGSVESRKAGRRRLVVATSLSAWMANLPTVSLKSNVPDTEKEQ